MEIQFGSIHLDYNEGEDTAVLTEPFKFSVDGVVYTVPKGFIWDGASLPRIAYLRYGTPFDKHHRRAGCAHDWLYSGNAPELTRREKDCIYRCGLVYDGQSKWLAFKEWLAVRLFGGSHYKEVE